MLPADRSSPPSSVWRPVVVVLLAILALSALAVLLAWGGLKYVLGTGGMRFDDSSSGWTAVWLGDVDADGVPDLALGVSAEPSALRGDGRVRILSGATGAMLAELRGMNLTNRLDDAVGSVRDLGGMGRPGLWWRSGHHDLRVSADGLGIASVRFDVDLGGPPSDLGDVDGDGAPDLLVSGYPRRNGTDTISALSTRTGKAIWTLSEPEPNELGADPFGWTACAAGDVDGDGAMDAAIVDGHSRVRLVSGRSGVLLRELEQRVDWITGILAPLGDVDGDGRPELAVYEAWNIGDSANDEVQGKPLRVVSCSDGSVLRTIDAGGIVSSAGSPGDVDGDGLGDLAWWGDGRAVVMRLSNGVRLGTGDPGAALRPGSADFDRDGFGDALVASNVVVPARIDPPLDLWRQGRIEIVSGRDGSVLRTFDEGVLPPRGD